MTSSSPSTARHIIRSRAPFVCAMLIATLCNYCALADINEPPSTADTAAVDNGFTEVVVQVHVAAGSVDVIAVKRFTEPRPTRRKPTGGDDGHGNGYVVHFDFDSAATDECELAQLHTHHEAFDDDGQAQAAEDAPVVAAVCAGVGPFNATSVTVTFGDYVKRATLSHRNFHALAANATTVVKTIQSVGSVLNRPNIIFVAAAYTSTQIKSFEFDVDVAMNLLQFPTTLKLVANRYLSVMNVYYVFQGSEQRGASRPLLDIVRENNLDCSYGQSTERFLACDLSKTMALASAAPISLTHTNNVVVALVDDDVYGGSSVFGGTTFVTWMYNRLLRNPDERKRAGSLLYHELGHSLGGLLDEYSLGTTAAVGTKTKNCHWANSGVPWQGWIDNGAVPATPSPVCGYTNFYKATTTCMMLALDNAAFCPVCTEATILSMYDRGMDITQPTCPPNGFALFMPPLSNLTLYLNNRLIKDGEFTIQWELDDVVISGATKSQIYLTTSLFQGRLGRHFVKATVFDNTSSVLDANRPANFRQSVVFEVNYVPNQDVLRTVPIFDCADYAGIFDLQPSRTKYWGTCGRSVCPLPELFVSRQEATIKLENVDKLIADFAFGVTGLIVLSCTMVGIMIWIAITRKFAAKPEFLREIVNTSKARFARIFLIVFGSLWASLCAVSMAFGISIFNLLGPSLKSIAISFITFLVFNIVVSFVHVTSAFFVAKRPLYFSTVLSILCLLLITFLFIMCMYVTFTVRSEGSWPQQVFRNIWEENAVEDPAYVCSLQALFECSGFDFSCTRLNNEHCPSGCEATNALYTEPCRPPLTEFIHKWMNIVSWVAFGGMVLTFAGCFSSSLLCRYLRSLDERHESEKKECMAILAKLNPHERQRLTREFRKMDTDRDGMIKRKEFSVFYQSTIGHVPADDEMEVVWNAVDRNKDGRASFPDFVLFMSAQRSVTPNVPPLDEQHPVYSEAKNLMNQLTDNQTYQMYVTYQCITSGGTDLYAFVAFYNHRAREDDVVAQFQYLDADEDGYLSWTDFVANYGAWKAWIISVVARDSPTRLMRFYERYNPSKITDVQQILVEWEGKHLELFSELVRKYGPEPLPTVNESHQRRLERFFQYYGINKLSEVDNALELYAGRENVLFRELCQKYGPEPSVAPSDW